MMRNIHPAAWAGLFLNFGMVYLLYSAIVGMDLSIFEGQDREILETLVRAVDEARPMLYAILAGQAVALGLIAMGMAAGVILAAASGFFLLPGSMVYLIGCALSYYRVKYADFIQAPPGYADAHFVFRSMGLSRTRIMTGALLLSALMLTLLGAFDMSLVLLGMGLGGVYCTVRAAKNQALSLHDDHLTISPAIFAARILIPYAAVRKAALLDDESITFEVETAAGVKELNWNLRAVAPQERRAALEELGAALTANNVPLY